MRRIVSVDTDLIQNVAQLSSERARGHVLNRCEVEAGLTARLTHHRPEMPCQTFDLTLAARTGTAVGDDADRRTAADAPQDVDHTACLVKRGQDGPVRKQRG